MECKIFVSSNFSLTRQKTPWCSLLFPVNKLQGKTDGKPQTDVIYISEEDKFRMNQLESGYEEMLTK